MLPQTHKRRKVVADSIIATKTFDPFLVLYNSIYIRHPIQNCLASIQKAPTCRPVITCPSDSTQP